MQSGRYSPGLRRHLLLCRLAMALLSWNLAAIASSRSDRSHPPLHVSVGGRVAMVADGGGGETVVVLRGLRSGVVRFTWSPSLVAP